MVALRDVLLANLVALAPKGASIPRQHESQHARSSSDPKVSLSFKETHICETTHSVVA